MSEIKLVALYEEDLQVIFGTCAGCRAEGWRHDL